MTDLPTTDAADLGMAFDLAAQAWVIVVHAQPATVVRAVQGAMQAADLAVDLVDATSGPASLRGALPGPATLAVGLEAWEPHHWQHFDELREQIREARPILVVVTTEAGAAAMAREAPQAWSYFKGAVLRWVDDGATPAQVEAALEGLRSHWGKTDAEVVALAVAGELPPDADFATWLVLMGRDDLLPPRGTP